MDVRTALLPILHEADWSGADFAACKPLIEGAPDVPFVALVLDGETERRTLTQAKLDEDGQRWDVMLARARAGLAHRALPMRPRADGTVVLVDEYASSVLAVPDELERLRRALDADGLLLAAPTRGLLVARSAPASGFDARFAAFAASAFAEAVEARISPLVFSLGPDGLRAERRTEAEPVRFEVVGYDEDAERLAVEVHGAVDTGAVRALEALARRGLDPSGRPVAELEVRARAGTMPMLRAALPADWVDFVTLGDTP